MNCPYCKQAVYGMTGFQEVQAFEKHLRRCRKNPNNIVLRDGKRAAVVPIKPQSVMDALNIRADSGQ
jgi:hypothetical protein